LLFGAYPLGDVLDVFDHADGALRGIAKRKRREIDPASRVVGRRIWDDRTVRLSGFQGANRRAPGADILSVLVDLITLLADQRLRLGIPPFHPAINTDDRQIEIEHADAVLNAVEDVAEKSLIVTDRRFRFAAFGHIPDDPL